MADLIVKVQRKWSNIGGGEKMGVGSKIGLDAKPMHFDASGQKSDLWHDASIEGTAYMTYTVVDNSTYIQACLDYCAGIEGCVFVNLFYEFNNALLDFVFSQKSNLKCAAYGDIHNATEKSNFDGQASYISLLVGNETVPLTYITQSSGWGKDTLVDPATPDGYELIFGPTGGANNAPGYMGFAFIGPLYGTKLVVFFVGDKRDDLNYRMLLERRHPIWAQDAGGG
ncbi:hypothetical protein K438DRAFT_2090621 [Mycena galopus ATCC 62051]|nr:hypothetical protein K438DRAFT_2090621 [Mycena galopus ATCC 62051]